MKLKFVLAALFVVSSAAQAADGSYTGSVTARCYDDRIAFITQAKENGFTMESLKPVMVGKDTRQYGGLMTLVSKEQGIRMTAVESEGSVCVISAEYFDQARLIQRFKLLK